MKYFNFKDGNWLLGGILILIMIVIGLAWRSHAERTAIVTSPAITAQELVGAWEMIHDNKEGGPMSADEHFIIEFRADGSYAEYDNGVLQGYELTKAATSSAMWSLVDTSKEPTIPIPGGETESIVGETVIKLVFPNETDYYFVTYDQGILSLEGYVSGYLDRYTKVQS